MGVVTMVNAPSLMSADRGRSSPLTQRYDRLTVMSLVKPWSMLRLPCWIRGFCQLGSSTKIEGLGIAAPAGTDGKKAGYVGTPVVNVKVSTLTPLFDIAVP